MGRLARTLAALGLMSMVEIRLLRYLDSGSLSHAARVASSLLAGQAPMRVWQNRLLGPFLVDALARLTGTPYVDAFQVVTEDLVVLTNLACFLLARRVSRSDVRALQATAILATAFVAMNDGGPVWVWDFVDLVTGVWFAYAMLTDAGGVALTALFAVELLNRESAYFVPLWMVLTAVDWSRRSSGWSVRWGRALWGLALLGVGIASVWLIRQHIYLQHASPADGPPSLGGQHFQLLHNLWRLMHPDGTVAYSIGAFWAFWSMMLQARRKLAAASIPFIGVGAAMSCAILISGVVTEPRIYVWLVAMTVMLFAFAAPEPAGAAESKQVQADRA